MSRTRTNRKPEAVTGGMTHPQIAEILGVSPQRVQQIEKRALAKLRKQLQPLSERIRLILSGAACFAMSLARGADMPPIPAGVQRERGQRIHARPGVCFHPAYTRAETAVFAADPNCRGAMRRVGHIGRMVVLLALCAGCRIVPAPAPFPPIPTVPAIERRLFNSGGSEEVRWSDDQGAAVAPQQTPHALKVTWNPAENVAGYKVYWGTESRQYTGVLDVGNTNLATIPNLEANQLYFVAATSYNLLGVESDFSNEASGLIPVKTNTVLLCFAQEAATPNGPWTDIGPPFLVRTNPTDTARFTRVRIATEKY